MEGSGGECVASKPAKQASKQGGQTRRPCSALGSQRHQNKLAPLHHNRKHNTTPFVRERRRDPSAAHSRHRGTYACGPAHICQSARGDLLLTTLHSRHGLRRPLSASPRGRRSAGRQDKSVVGGGDFTNITAEGKESTESLLVNKLVSPQLIS